MQDLIAEFVVEAGENLEQIVADLLRLEGNPADARVLNGIFRLLHTIKGTSGFLGLNRLQAVAHAGETLLDRYRRNGTPMPPAAFDGILAAIDRVRQLLTTLGETGAEPVGDDADLLRHLTALDQGTVAETPPVSAAVRPAAPKSMAVQVPTEGPDETSAAPTTSVRVDLRLLETMLRLTSELVLSRNQLLRLHGEASDDPYTLPLQQLSAITAELQDTVMQTRMQPIGLAWKVLPRLVRELSRELGKEVALDLSGAETEVDRQLLDAVRDPILHIVRNAVDHGIEAPDRRAEVGKPRVGVIRARATKEGNWINVRIEDDGRGLDSDRIRARAVENQLLTAEEAAGLSESATFALIFAPGFSTADAVTNISGRGVGMDVVRANIERIGGQVEITSRAGQGSCFVLRIPLTVAIMLALLIRAGGQQFAIALSSVAELIRLDGPSDPRISHVADRALLQVRDELMDLNSLSGLLGLEAPGAGRYAMVIELGDRRFAVTVDEIVDTEEIVIKPVSEKLRDLPEYGGTTILGDGSVTLILEPGCLAGPAGAVSADRRRRPAEATAAEDDPPVAILYLDVGQGAPVVATMALVRRLERVPVHEIRHGASGPVMTYFGRVTPIVAVDGVRLQSDGVQPLVILAEGDDYIAVAVDRIVDMDELPLDVVSADRGPGRLGTALIRDIPYAVLDLEHYRRTGLARLRGDTVAVASGCAA
jgi:two-component system chemotaxis sensor kinase CheA